MKRYFTVEIEKMVYGGQGMGRVEGKVVFVPFTAPGDRVEIELVREKKDYAEAALRKIEKSSLLRTQPFCVLFGNCGGCQYQHLSYSVQLKLKEEAVKETLHRLTPPGGFEILPIIPSLQDREYRLRAQFKGGRQGGKITLGFYAWRTHRVVEVQECPLLHPLANRIQQGVQNWLKERSEIPVKSLDIQVSPDEGRGVVGLRGEGSFNPHLADEMGQRIPEVKGVVLEGKERSLWGDLTLTYLCPEILGKKELQVQTSGESFFQVNLHQNWNLMQKVVEWAGLTGQEKVLDLFCGSGNLTLPLAQRARKIWGIDQDRQAVEHGAENARKNHLPHCTFLAARAEEGIRLVRAETPSVDVAVLDPPRVGARKVLDLLVSLRPQKILYVSCEPPTLARDLARMIALGYKVKRIQPLDMFPQTYHIEMVAELIP